MTRSTTTVTRRRPVAIRWASVAALGALTTMLVFGRVGLAAESGLGFKYDPNQKIKISADSMEVRQSEHTANFKGNVVAVQGDLKMTADSVKVFYSLETPPAGQSTSTTHVDRIDAEGNVHIDSPSENATGNWGIYDVGRQLLTVGGTVILTRGETTIKGSRLELDLKSGKSRMVSSTSDSESGRVQGVFAPPADNKNDAKK